MFDTGKTSVSFTDVMDDRNERPLTIALTTIVAVWSIAIALTLASERLGSRNALTTISPAAVVNVINK